MNDEWGPWIVHDGSGCPVPVGSVVHIVLGRSQRGRDPMDQPDGWCGDIVKIMNNAEAVLRVAGHDGSWFWSANYYPVIRYRVRKPFALLLLRELAASPPPLPARTPAAPYPTAPENAPPEPVTARRWPL